MTTWDSVKDAVAEQNAFNVCVRENKQGETCLFGNDGTVLSFDPTIALQYVESNWDAANCRPA